jgi:hypothetical protein
MGQGPVARGQRDVYRVSSCALTKGRDRGSSTGLIADAQRCEDGPDLLDDGSDCRVDGCFCNHRVGARSGAFSTGWTGRAGLTPCVDVERRIRGVDEQDVGGDDERWCGVCVSRLRMGVGDAVPLTNIVSGRLFGQCTLNAHP